LNCHLVDIFLRSFAARVTPGVAVGHRRPTARRKPDAAVEIGRVLGPMLYNFFVRNL